jgi:predicted protein tyrosine phosphatase
MQTIFGLTTVRMTICGMIELGELPMSEVSHIVSILDPGSDGPHCLKTVPSHARLDLRFHDIIDERDNMVCPQRDDIQRLLRFGRTLDHDRESCTHLLIHCEVGISRSTAAAVLLFAQAFRDEPSGKAVERMLKARPYSWPNTRMIELGDELLERGGELITAVDRHYRAMVERFPELAAVIRLTR